MRHRGTRTLITVRELRDILHSVIRARFTPTRAFLAILFLAACEGHSPATLEACTNARTTRDFRQCVDQEIELSERQLAAALDSAKVRSPSEAAVDSTQSAWLRYRKAQCEAEARTAVPAPVPRCWLALTRRRIAEVRQMYATHAQ
jgi:uncharacterized protein YecT (DUF1311 family)